MGNTAVKEFNEQELSAASIDEKNAFGSTVVTTEALTLTGKTSFGAKPGYAYHNQEKKVLFQTQAEGSIGRKGEILDGEDNVLATVRIDHKRKEGHHKYYKTEAVYEDQASEKVDDKVLYLFSKIETSRSGADIHCTYSVATGKDDDGNPVFLDVYKSKRIVAGSFKSLVETEDGKPVAKISSIMGLPRLKLEVAAGVDLAAVILTGEAVAPNGDMISQLPGATIGP